MPKFDVTVSSPVPKTFRAAKVEGMFDVPHRDIQVLRWSGDLPIEDGGWSVGAIVGASGSGKSTIARSVFGPALAGSFEWSAACVLDDFDARFTPQQVVEVLSAVGFSSPPAWLRPYRVLSTGQQFRATLARALLERDELAFDEFTSVVDRTVARSASVALAKHVRRAGKRFVAVTCHRDVLDWLEVDWVYDTDTHEFRRCLWRRPPIHLAVHPGDRTAWPLFRGHHYLTGDLSPSARIFLAFVRLGEDANWAVAGFFSLMPAMGMRGWRRGHRTVVLPDYQGLGIGNRMIETTAEALWRKERLRFRATTSAIPLVRHRRRHPEMWRMVSGPVMKRPSGNTKIHVKTSAGRLSTAWEYIPEELRWATSAPRSGPSALDMPCPSSTTEGPAMVC